MRFRVIWISQAEQALAAVWLNATDRAAVTRAAHQIDQELQTDAHLKGESRPNDRRVLFSPPLGVIYWVDLPQQVVYVLHVWQFRSRQP